MQLLYCIKVANKFGQFAFKNFSSPLRVHILRHFETKYLKEKYKIIYGLFKDVIIYFIMPSPNAPFLNYAKPYINQCYHYPYQSLLKSNLIPYKKFYQKIAN